MDKVSGRLAVGTLCALSLLLAACGGGGGGESAAAGDSVTVAAGGKKNGGGTASTTFAATVTQAPADGATISGTVSIELNGSGIKNAELLPESGYGPVLARFTVAPDGRNARLDFDTTTVPNYLVKLRVSAFNSAPGTAGKEIIAMPVRSWTLANDPAPAGSPEGRAIKCQMQGKGFTPLNEPPVVCISHVPTPQPMTYEQCTSSGNLFGTGYASPIDALPVKRDGNSISKLYCTPPALGGIVNEGCRCLQSSSQAQPQ